jgi:hypothetical protein
VTLVPHEVSRVVLHSQNHLQNQFSFVFGAKVNLYSHTIVGSREIEIHGGSERSG